MVSSKKHAKAAFGRLNQKNFCKFRLFERFDFLKTYDWHQLGRKLKEAVVWPRFQLDKWIGIPDHLGSIWSELRSYPFPFRLLPQKSWLSLEDFRLHIWILFLSTFFITWYYMGSIVPCDPWDRFSTARFTNQTEFVAFIEGANNRRGWDVAAITCGHAQIFGLSCKKKIIWVKFWKGRNEISICVAQTKPFMA